MTSALQLETARLTLRPWLERDRVPFAAMNADPEVMAFFASPMTREQSDEAIERYTAACEREGFSFLAAEHRLSGDFVGIVGLQTMRDIVPHLPQPAVEVGWRLRRVYQGQGLATEAAQAVLHFAFQQVRLPSLVAITATGNIASRRVMQKLNMTYRPDLDFDHPRLPAGHPHQRHALYELNSPLHKLHHSHPLGPVHSPALNLSPNLRST